MLAERQEPLLRRGALLGWVKAETPMADLPEGFLYGPDLITVEEERDLLDAVRRIEFTHFKMHGVDSRRRVAHFGWLYGYESWKVEPGPPIPDFLLVLRQKLARWMQVDSERLVEALVTEYSPGAGIGWHRDAPPFGIVVACSLLSACRFRLRRGSKGRTDAAVMIAPRSGYALTGAARRQWQHSISPAKELRYSITFRTLRKDTVMADGK
jgi:alkylated DNA repair dioxygenase AlkB